MRNRFSLRLGFSSLENNKREKSFPPKGLTSAANVALPKRVDDAGNSTLFPIHTTTAKPCRCSPQA
jgi:hypothetical protein